MLKNLTNGYTSRGATMDDAETAVNLMNEYSRHYLGTDEAPLDVIRNEWVSPGFQPETNTRLVFSPEGKAVDFSKLKWLVIRLTKTGGGWREPDRRSAALQKSQNAHRPAI